MKEAVINEIILEMQSKADNGQLIELKSALERISPVIKVIVDKIQANEQENEKLVAIRDVLLPKLMSGEIDVSNVDISALTSTDKLSFRCRSPPKNISYRFSRYFPLGSVICDFFIRQFVEFSGEKSRVTSKQKVV